MKIHRSGSVVWTGDLKDGVGSISTQSGALAAYPYGFQSRFEGVAGSNPEELLAAAHAACFTMALSLVLGQVGLQADRMETKATVLLEQAADGFAITAVSLHLDAAIPGTDDATFQRLAVQAKITCPVSKLVNAEVTLTAILLP
jgi:lipoyl-dependent peroxiredoxin